MGGSPTGSPMLFHRPDFCMHDGLLGRTWEVSGKSQAPEHHCNPISRVLLGRVTWKLRDDTDPHWPGAAHAADFPLYPQDYLLCLF